MLEIAITIVCLILAAFAAIGAFLLVRSAIDSNQFHMQ